MNEPLFPKVKIDINSPAGNAYVIIGTIKDILRQARFDKAEIDKVVKDMMSGDYNHLLEVASYYITIKVD